MKTIAKQLGLTPSGLKTLARATADPAGWATGPGKGYGAMGACGRLAKTGLVELAPSSQGWGEAYRITELGRDMVRRARALGF